MIAELVDGCKLHCAICWNRSRKGSMKSMPLKLVETILDKYGGFPKVQWYIWGEPLLHENFVEVADMVKDAQSWISSSLSLPISKEKLEALHKFKVIIVSMSGLTKSVYNIYHRDGNFELVAENLLDLAAGKKDEQIAIRWLSHPKNEHQLGTLMQLAGRIGIDVTLTTLHCEVESQLNHRDGNFELVEENRGFKHELIGHQKHRDGKFCTLVGNILVGVDGDYLLCCASRNVKIGLHIKDNVTQEEIKQAQLATPLCKECRKQELWRLY